jgi:hypothetical protein
LPTTGEFEAELELEVFDLALGLVPALGLALGLELAPELVA